MLSAAQPRSAVLQALADIPVAQVPPMAASENVATGAVIAKADEAYEGLSALYATYYPFLHKAPQSFTEDIRPQLKPVLESARDIMTLTAPLRTGDSVKDGAIQATIGSLLTKRRKAYLDHANRVISAFETSPKFQQDLADAQEITGPNAQKRSLNEARLDAMQLSDKATTLYNLEGKDTDTIAASIAFIRQASKAWIDNPPGDEALKANLDAIAKQATEAEKQFGLKAGSMQDLLPLSGSRFVNALSKDSDAGELIDPSKLLKRIAATVGKAMHDRTDQRWSAEELAAATKSLHDQYRESANSAFPALSGQDMPLPEFYQFPPKAKTQEAGLKEAVGAAAALAAGAAIAASFAKTEDAPAPATSGEPGKAPETLATPPALPAPTDPVTVLGRHTADVAKERVEPKKENGPGK